MAFHCWRAIGCSAIAQTALMRIRGAIDDRQPGQLLDGVPEMLTASWSGTHRNNRASVIQVSHARGHAQNTQFVRSPHCQDNDQTDAHSGGYARSRLGLPVTLRDVSGRQ
jgi:hypothetical protein